MRRTPLIAGLSSGLLVVVLLITVARAVASWPGVVDRHFASGLPQGTPLEHDLRSPAAFDSSYAFVLSAPDDQWRDRLVRAWHRSPMVDSDARVTSFVALDPPPWWPADPDALATERYARSGDQVEQHWSVWIHRGAGKLYAEHGRW